MEDKIGRACSSKDRKAEYVWDLLEKLIKKRDS
jgi:hypothetical protein